MGGCCDGTREGAPAGAGVPSFAFYRDRYGGTLDAESYAEAMPAALRLLRELCGGVRKGAEKRYHPLPLSSS